MIEIPEKTWHQEARCVIDNVPVDTFFPEKAEGLTIRDTLSKMCMESCPVRVECLQQALDTTEQGWWGCTSPKERQKIHNLGLTAAQYVKEQARGNYKMNSVGRNKIVR